MTGIILTVEIEEKREVVSTEAGKPLLEVLREKQIYINSPCGGRGTCGKCRITIRAGRLGIRVSETEQEGIAKAGEVALACRSFLIEDCTIDLSHLQEQDFAGNADFGVLVTDAVDTGLDTICFTASKGIWEDGRSVTEIIAERSGRRLSFTSKALRQLSEWMGEALKHDHEGPGADRPVFLTIRGERVLLARTDESKPVYGIGVDIGTTTVAFSLVDMNTGTVCRSLSLLNSQRQYGGDVVSRIQKAGDGWIDALRDCICSDIVRGCADLCDGEQAAVVRMVIAGNTTMLHLLLGLRGDSLAMYPFTPVTTASMEVPASELFGLTLIECDVTLLPSVGAYVGADILAGLMYCKIGQSSAISLFIDVGTNGEMAISGKTGIFCASTAAGPAFEGANIIWGIGSVPGAISSFDFFRGEASFTTIGNLPALGICGSAVVDIVAACLRSNVIDRTGRFVSDETGTSGLPIAKNPDGEWIRFHQKDVREFQLAKSAIRSGLEILLKESGCCWEDVGEVFLAGGFGSRINVNNAVEVGLFPEELRGKIQPVGNSALGGTVKYLLCDKGRQQLENLRAAAKVMDLSQQPAFNDLFLDHLQF